MTTALETAPGPAAAVGDSSGRTEKAGLGRLTAVELRKLADTRAGLWLLIIIGLAVVATAVIQLLTAAAADQSFDNFLQFALLPTSVLLPVLGILSMTGEWSQRTALTTFTLVPERSRVIAAKLLAGVLIALAASAVGFGVAATANLIAGGHHWTMTAAVAGQTVLGQVLYVLMGLGFGALLMNSPLALVTYFALPLVWTILGATIKGLRHVSPWLDMSVASGPLGAPGMTSTDWAHLATAAGVWVLLPLVLGTLRALRREVA